MDWNVDYRYVRTVDGIKEYIVNVRLYFGAFQTSFTQEWDLPSLGEVEFPGDYHAWQYLTSSRTDVMGTDIEVDESTWQSPSVVLANVTPPLLAYYLFTANYLTRRI